MFCTGGFIWTHGPLDGVFRCVSARADALEDSHYLLGPGMFWLCEFTVLTLERKLYRVGPNYGPTLRL